MLTTAPKVVDYNPTQFGEMTKRFLTTQVASLRQTVSRRTNVKTQHAFRTAEISIHPTSTVAAARLHALFTFACASDTALSLTITPTPPITSVNSCCYLQEGALGGGLRLAHGAQDSISDIPYDQTLRAYKARLPVVCRPGCAQASATYRHFRCGLQGCAQASATFRVGLQARLRSGDCNLWEFSPRDVIRNSVG